MTINKQIIAYYVNAREQIKLNNPLLARKYVLMILNIVVQKYYEHDISIVAKAKTAVFLDKWLAVSRDLYNNGITDYVRSCFGLIENKEKQPAAFLNQERQGARTLPAKDKSANGNIEEGAQRPVGAIDNNRDIDFSGLIDETADEQGWGAEVFESNKLAVVQISAMAATSFSSGTGFIISKNGYLLTNNHVVFEEQNGAYHNNLKMSLLGEEKKHAINVLFSDKKKDVALCKFEPAEVLEFRSVRRIADYSKVKPGADCLVIGNAFGMGLAPCIGNIRFTKNDSGNLVYTIPSNPGDSGGPVFNRNGECIGMNKSKTVAVNGTVAEGYANAIPMDAIDELLQKWKSSNDITF